MLASLFKKRKKNQYGWFGDYLSWAQVSAESAGYNSDVILERTKDALLKVKNGEAVYERDSVIFDKKEYPHALMAFLQFSSSLKRGPLNILDFGGSLGSTYYQLKEFLTPEICSGWNVVEQQHYVDCGKANFEDEVLKFYPGMVECWSAQKIDLVILSGSVQYLENPHAFLQELASFNFDFILFDRTAFNNRNSDRLTLQIVPPEIYPASYPSWFFHQELFLSHFSNQYKVVASFPSFVPGEANLNIDGRQAATNKGFYLINSSRYA